MEAWLFSYTDIGVCGVSSAVTKKTATDPTTCVWYGRRSWRMKYRHGEHGERLVTRSRMCGTYLYVCMGRLSNAISICVLALVDVFVTVVNCVRWWK